LKKWKKGKGRKKKGKLKKNQKVKGNDD